MNNRYYSSYRRFTFDWDYADQEEYSNYERSLEDLEVKEVISDEEYNSTVSRLESSNDMVGLENYRDHFISESEYFFTREELLEGMKNLQAFYRVSEEKLAEDKRIRASYSRDVLGRFKASGYAALRNVDVASLNEDEVIDLHRVVTYGKSSDEIRNIMNASIKDRITKSESEPVVLPNPEPEPVPEFVPTSSDIVLEDREEEKEVSLTDIEAELNRFKETSDRIKNQFNEIDRNLVLSDEVDLNVNDAIAGLGNELSELREMGNLIIADMDAYRLSSETADFSMSVADIKKTVKEFCTRFKNLKNLQIERYNAKVELINNKIKELRNLTDLEPSVSEMINGLTELSKCDITVKSWTQVNYLKQLDYDKLVSLNKVVSDINSKLGVTVKEKDDSLEGDISYIESETKRLETEAVAGLDDENVSRINQDLDILSTNIDNFNLKLEANKDNISEEEYNVYKSRAEVALDKLNEMRKKLVVAPSVNKNDYNGLDNKVSLLELDVNRLCDDIESFYSYVTKGGVDVFNVRLSTFVGRLSDLKEEIEEKHKNEKIDINQYNSLMNRVNDMESKLTECKDKLMDPGMIKNADIYEGLNGEVNDLKKENKDLEILVGSLNKPIKKEDRKKIDARFKEIEKELNRLEKIIKQYKDKEPEKYSALVEKLNDVKNELDNVSKDYRKNCPLHVRAVKSAKKFYKKHKKLVLISAGLAALVLVSSPVLIPAVMHGNIMVGFCSPALRPFVKFSNKILGGMMGATLDSRGIWMLANGTVLNPQTAAISLLKGLALSGVGHAALVSPIAVPATYSVVVGVKKLVEKMKTKELKQKLVDGKEKIKESVKSGKEKVVNNVKGKSSSNKVKKADRDAIAEISELLRDFRKSGKSLEDFAIDENLTEEDVAMMKYLITSSNEYKNTDVSEKNVGKAR